MLVLQATDITKSYGTFTVLSHISIQINERERIGLVGVNGAGKSTLLRVLAGESSYDSGEIHKPKTCKVGYLAQNSGLHTSETIGHEMRSVFADLLEVEAELRELERLMAMPDIIASPQRHEQVMARYAVQSDSFRERGGYEIEAKIRGILHGMGFGQMQQDTPIHTLSGGQRTRLALARLLLQEPDVLLLDEPTNHLDIATLTWLENHLRSYSGAMIIVSHDRYFLDATVQTIVEIERNAAKRYTGNYSKFVELKAAEQEQLWKQYEKQQTEISKMEEFVQRNIARASTTGRAKSRRAALERMERLDRPAGELRRASFRFEIAHATGKEVLRATGISHSYRESAPILKQVSLQLRRGDSVALIGPNGIGKSTLLKAISGRLELQAGQVEWGTKVKVGFYDQEQSELNPNNTILAEVWDAFPEMEELRIRTILGGFLFSGEDVSKKISTLSGGEKARVSLAKLMLLQANVLILDEPTNHLDLYSREILESSLLEYEGTLLFISHDRYFLNKIAENIIELSADGVEYFLGNYDDYLDKKQELVETRTEAGQAPQTVSSGTGSADYAADKQAKREERAKQRRIEQLEEQIAELEQQIADWETEMARPDVAQDYEKLKSVQLRIDEARVELERCYDAWGELAES